MKITLPGVGDIDFPDFTDPDFESKLQQVTESTIAKAKATPPASALSPRASATPAQPEEETGSGGGAVFRGLIGGLMNENPEGIADTIEAIGRLTKPKEPANIRAKLNEELAAKGLPPLPDEQPSRLLGLADRVRKISTYTPDQFESRAKSLEEIVNNPDLGDAFTWLGEGLGKAAASSLVPILGAGAGAVAGSAVPGIGTAAGALGGMFSGSMLLNYGEVYRTLVQNGMDPDEAARFGLSTAIGMSALDTASGGLFLRNISKPARKEGIGAMSKYLVKKGAEGALTEGGTELVQEALKEFTKMAGTGVDVDPYALAEAAIIGTTFGAVSGAGTSAVGALRDEAGPTSNEERDAMLQASYAKFKLRSGEAIKDSPQDKMTGDQWIQYLKNRNIKQEEIEDTNLEAFLADYDGPITKDQILGILESGQAQPRITILDGTVVNPEGVEIRDRINSMEAQGDRIQQEANRKLDALNEEFPFLKETNFDLMGFDATLGDLDNSGPALQPEDAEALYRINPNFAVAFSRLSQAERQKILDTTSEVSNSLDEIYNLQDEIESQQALFEQYGSANAPVWKAYTSFGGENYREVLLQAPKVFAPQEMRDAQEELRFERNEYYDEYNKLKETLPEGKRGDLEKLVSYNTGLDPKADNEVTRNLAKGILGEGETLNRMLDILDGWKRVDTELYNLQKAKDDYEKYTVGGHGFKHSHWGGREDVIVHLRLKDRVGPDGERMLFIEEIQSDPHQMALKQGYVTQPSDEIEKKILKARDQHEAAVATLEKINQELSDLLGVSREVTKVTGFPVEPKGKVSAYKKLKYQSLLESRAEAMRDVTETRAELDTVRDMFRNQARGIPNLPFKKSWHTLALKQAMRMAAEGGYDSIGITNGHMQALRNNLYRNDTIQTFITAKPGGKFDLSTATKTIAEDVTPSMIQVKLEEYFKENRKADKVEISSDQLREAIFAAETEGGDIMLPVYTESGGRGRKHLYDKIIPGAMDKYAKQMGWNTKTEKFRLYELSPDRDERNVRPANNIHLMRVTPEMKAFFNNGLTQPLYVKQMQPIKGSVSSNLVETLHGAGRTIGEKQAQVRHLYDLANFLTGEQAAVEILDRQDFMDRLEEITGEPWSMLEPTLGVTMTHLIAVLNDRSFGNPTNTMAHEAFHFIQNFVLNKGEKKMLEKQNAKVRELAIRAEAYHDMTHFDISPNEAWKEARERVEGQSPRELQAMAAAGFVQNREWMLEGRGSDAITRALEKAAGFWTRFDTLVRGITKNRVSPQDQAVIDLFTQFADGILGTRAAERNPEVADRWGWLSGWSRDAKGWFSNWIKDSIIVNEDGSPRVVYHGTYKVFDTFAITNDIGFHFASDPIGATNRLLAGGVMIDEYTLQNADPKYIDNLIKKGIEGKLSVEGRSAVVYPTFLNLKNPLRMSDLGTWRPTSILEMLRRDGHITTEKHAEIYETWKKEGGVAGADEVTYARRYKELKNLIRSLGYDGIVYKNTIEEHGQDSYIAFEPTQIKSVFAPNVSNDPRFDRLIRQISKLGNVRKSRQRVGNLNSSKEWRSFAKITADNVFMPYHLAMSNPEFAQITGLVLDRRNRRTENIRGFRANQKTGEPYWDAVAALPRESRQRIGAALEIADYKGIRLARDKDGTITIKNDKDLPTQLSKYGDTITLSKEEADGLDAYRKGLDWFYDRAIETTKIMGGIGADIDTVTLGTLLKELEKLDINNMSPLELQAFINDLGMMEILPSDLEKARKRFNVNIDNYRKVITRVDQLNKFRRSDYFPHMRFGDRGISVHDSKGKLIHFEGVQTRGFKNKAWRIKAQQRITELKKQFPNGTVSPKPFLLKYQTIRDKAQDLAVTFDNMLATLPSVDAETHAKIMEDMYNQVAERGFGRHFMERKNIPGYETDLIEIMGHFMTSASIFDSNLHYNRAMNNARATINKSNPEIASAINQYVEYVNDPFESWGWIRTLGFFAFLWGRFSSGLVQLATMPIIADSYMSQFTAGMKNPVLPQKMLFDATGDILATWTKSYDAWFRGKDKPLDPFVGFNPRVHKGQTPGEAEAVLKATINGELHPAMTDELRGFNEPASQGPGGQWLWLGRGAVKGTVNAAFEAGSALFNVPEVMGRSAVFLAAYRAYISNEKFRKNVNRVFRADEVWIDLRNKGRLVKLEDAAYEFAMKSVRETFGIFGKENLAGYLRGGIQRGVFQYQPYVQMVIEGMVRMAWNKYGRGIHGKKAAARMAAWLFVFSGFLGLPFFEDLKDIVEVGYKTVTGIDLDIEKEVAEMANDIDSSGFLGESLLRGPVRAMGVDISQRTGLGSMPATDVILGALGVRGQQSDLLGAPISYLLEQSGKAIEAGEIKGTGAALKEFLPVVMRDVATAMEWNRNGVRTGQGYQLLKREDLNYSQILLKAMGFTPTEIARARERWWRSTRAQHKYDLLRERLYAKLTETGTEMLRSSLKGDNEAFEEARRKHQEILEGVVRRNSKASIDNQIIIDIDKLWNDMIPNKFLGIRSNIPITRRVETEEAGKLTPPIKRSP